MKTEHESSNNENSSKSDEKSSSPSIPEHNILETQTSSNKEDQASGQVADNDADANVKKCNPPETETMNLPESSTTKSSATEIAKPSSSKSALELKPQSSLQEDIQTIKSDKKLENYDKLHCTKPSSTELSSAESSLTESLKATLNESKQPCILDFSRTKIKKIAIRFEDILNYSITQNLEFPFAEHKLMTTYMKQIPQEDNSDNMIESSESDQKSKECQNKKIENRQKYQKMSTYELLQWALVIAKSKLLITFIIFFTSILPMSVMHEIIKKLRHFKPMFMIIYDNYDNLFKVQKDKKPEDIRNTKVKVCRKIYSSKYFVKILFLLVPIVSVLISLFYFPFGLVRKNENDEHADPFATAIVEVEEGILDHDATVRVLTEYLERDTPLLKVIALIGETSVDKPYTVDIIKKSLRKRRNNSFSPSLPSFIVLENLRAEHSTVVIDYVETYQEAYSNQEFTIVAVFKVEQIDDDLTRADINHVINKVKDIFIEANIIMKIIPFQPLSEDALEKYIINTAENIGQTLSQDQIDYNKRRLIDDFANCQKEYGCYKDHI
ncbi:uncharacterized protein LOC126849887 [Cataglyphis hispanica]|uniref:uncharacterized protein LOC126849887 n=1 Tax=Cataglyphis hispanica TaxID=1086592 RepID=UPI00217FFE54|nr:uncharacterized protein LOC126849887 [Cataglyphis hispanica]XP_050448197.1 uncharacterized protein LOC126849887 [Cataglyphis hispanica]